MVPDSDYFSEYQKELMNHVTTENGEVIAIKRKIQQEFNMRVVQNEQDVEKEK